MKQTPEPKPDLARGKRILAHYWQAVRQHPWFFFPLVFLLPLGVFLINFAQPYIVAQIIDILSEQNISGDAVWDAVGTWVILFILAAIIGELIIWRVIVFLAWSLEQRVAYDLYQQSFMHLSAQSANFHATRMGGSLVSQTNKYVNSYIQMANTFTFQVLPLASALTFTFLILTPIVPWFALGLALLCVAFVSISVLSFRRVRKLNEEEAITNNRLSGLVADVVTNILAVKSFGREKVEQKVFQEANMDARHATNQAMKAVIYRDLGFGFVLVAGSIFMLFMLAGGPGWFGISIGTLVLISSYSFAIFNRLWGFNNIMRDFNRGLGNAAPMVAILDTSIDIKDPRNPEQPRITKGEIAFNHVTYAHADAKDDVLFHDFNLNISAGERVGLVGHSGSGKTTLTKLLLRFVDIDKGTITIDGQDITRIKQDNLREHIAYVPQEPLLFHRTIEENIAYGKQGASVEEIRKAAKRAHALDFIEKLPYGMSTVVGERGVKLSGGQRQRIAIARALLKNAPIIVLDEATSALDSESEQLIQDALWTLMQNRTAIVIAHRLSTIQQMDRIIVLEHGSILEQGSHRSLIRKKGAYAALWSHQSGGFIES